MSGTLVGISSSDRGFAADAESNARFRTNIGLFNDSPDTVEVEIALLADDGSLLAARRYALLPYSGMQTPATDITLVPFSRATVRVTPPLSLRG